MQVPYAPVPTEKVNAGGTPGLNVSVSATAFGSQAAEAQGAAAKMVEHADVALYGQISDLGKEFGKVGNEMWERAVALQQLRNDTEARNAEAKYMLDAGTLHANYNSLTGKAAVDAFPGYMEGLKAAREKIRDTLSNDDSKRRYDGPSQTLLSRSIFNGAGHAATANKQWQLNTAKSEMELDAKTVEDDPKDDILFHSKLKRTRDNAAQIAAIQGYEPGSAPEQELALKASSALWSQRIIGLSRTAPFEAAALLDANKTRMTGQDFLRVDNSVRSQARAVGAANIADFVYKSNLDEEGKSTKTLAFMEDEVAAHAKANSPDDPILVQHAIASLRGKYNQDKSARRQEELANLEVVRGALLKGPIDIRQMRMDPKVAAAIDALPASKQVAIPGEINRFNASANKISNQENYNRLWGMSNNDVEAFLNTDVTKEGLSQEDMRKMMEKQRKLKEYPSQDPRVGRAIGQIRGAMGSQLEALKIYKREAGNKDEYDKFTGAVQAALDVWTEEKKSPPTYKDVVETIGPQVIKQVSEPGMLWGTNETRFFKQAVPSAFADKVKADVVAKGGTEPTPEQIHRAYIRIEFIKLYGKKEAK